MKGYVHDIEKAAQQNKTFRKVLYTAKNCQLVVMSLKPGEDIGAEVHKLESVLLWTAPYWQGFFWSAPPAVALSSYGTLALLRYRVRTPALGFAHRQTKMCSELLR